ncbi:MAG: hypothetical protein WA294_19660 [Acidobacteriaceae bacterium]
MARAALTRVLLAPLALAVAGCGTMNFPSAAGNASFSVSASATSVATNGEVRLRASLPSGEAAPVSWAIASGSNATALGQGHIDPSGIYTAPGSLSADNVPVRIEAHLESNLSSVAALTLTLHPAFVQPLLPQDVALTPGATAEVTAQIAEVDAGHVRWSLSSSPTGSAAASGSLGTLGISDCRRGDDRYTTCTVTYTAPATLPAEPVYVIASVNGTGVTAPLRLLLNGRGIVSDPVTNQSIQTGAASLGTSGGNDGDYDTYEDKDGNSYVADCCGGTLGALVEDDQKNQYILSNNHVLAESDQANPGDTIDQPGLIDGACTPLSRPGSILHPLATLKYAVPLNAPQTNVDAALALAAPGAVDPTGSILQLGPPGQNQTLTAAPPMAGHGEALTAANLGMDVAKSGRTTGLTCSSIDAVALSVKVDYYRDCAETQPYTTRTFTNQIGISGTHFTDSGDSGALVLDAGNAQAVGLYFAGGTDGDGHGLSVANPIGDVLQELGTQAGGPLSIVGTNTPHAVACLRYDPAVPGEPPQPAGAALSQAQIAADIAASILHGGGILGAAPGSSLDNPGSPAVVVYTDRPDAAIPQTIDGLRTQIIVTDAASVARGTAPRMPVLEPGLHLSAASLAEATAVAQRVAPGLMNDPAIFGVGVTQSYDNPAEAALLVLVDIGRNPQSMPATINGLRVRYLRLHRFHTTRERDEENVAPNACSLRGFTPSH